ncbi:hypothetical protein ACQW5G_04710 [Fructilactobacillus sp. Tb1]|uniref:hypothetical protein n=1 Tax=Fructilactobacillus sp. Tb1 TaxID=3422304 RepID=UPI003D26C0A1
MKEIIAAALVLMMLLCLAVEAVVYVFVKNPSSGQKLTYALFDKIYCFCLFLICMLVVLLSVVHGS